MAACSRNFLNFVIMKRPETQISVVIPVYNRAGIVGRTLDSVAAQSARPLEVILVDNASTDGSGALLREWAGHNTAPDFRVRVLDECRRGAACARNRGLEAVETPWTMFFDSDDVMLPGHIDRILTAIEAYPEVDLFGWDVCAYGVGGKPAILPFEPRHLAWHNIMHGSLATQRYCARTELFRRAGGWCDRLGTWDDIELGTRLLTLRPCVMKLSGAPAVEMYHSSESVSGPSYAASMEQSLLALRETALSYASLGPLSHLLLKQAVLAADCVRDGRSDASVLLDDAFAREKYRRNRMAYRLAYLYRLAGGRGAARLFKPLLK